MSDKIFHIRPSRRFLIQQAVLNAAHAQFPLSRPPAGCGRWLAWLTRDGANLPGWFYVAVIREFNKLSQRWAA